MYNVLIHLKECDLGQKSILHAVKTRTRMPSVNQMNVSIIEEEEQEPTKPLSQTLIDLQLESQERENISEDGMVK